MFAELYRGLLKESANWDNETELRHSWISNLEKVLGIKFGLERGRRDSSYNNVVLEFKDKGLFKNSDASPSFKEAIYERLLPYIERTSKAEGIDSSEYIGIAIDGNHISFAQVTDGEIKYGPLMPFSEATVEMVATACKNSSRRAVTTINLTEDFGHESEAGIDLMAVISKALSEELKKPGHNKIKMLFEEWRTLYGQVADLSKEQISTIQKSIRFKPDFPKSVQVPALLFVIHTYNSLLIKLLAAEIISSHDLTAFKYFSQNSISLRNEELIKVLKSDIEHGGLFQGASIKGFVEEAIFSWYLDACNDKSKYYTEFCDSIRETLIKLSLYRTDNLESARSNDVLKHFYQNLVPETLRKSLGEFYTPDWLVNATLDKIEIESWLGKRILDPTCGSGSFLLSVIKRKRAEAEKLGWTPKQTLKEIVENVWGFDLNPLAVQAARVNFLIAVSDLLKKTGATEFELPVLLADAIYSPAPDPAGDLEVVHYRIGSQIANLDIQLPSELALDRKRLDSVFEIMGLSIEKDLEFEDASKLLIKSDSINNEELEKWRENLSKTYNRVLDLHKKNWNGIWFRIVRNFFWSATAGKFDAVVGNPPWVRWSKLPELYRERVKPTCLQYSIFSSTPHHGGNELDISGMITYTVADKWLKLEGKLAFVITQTHFQSPSSEGFRNFKIDNESFLIPISVDDLKELKPFPDAANRTAIAIFRKGLSEPIYPIPYTTWQNLKPFTKAIPENLELSQVLERTIKEVKEATPVSGPGSPWAILPKGKFETLKKLQGKSLWVQGRKGITCDLNGIYFVEIHEVDEEENLVKIKTRPNAGKKDIGPERAFWIETDLLYPLLKGASDFSACRIHPKGKLYTIVPNEGISKASYEQAEAKVDIKLRKSRKYFQAYEELLSTRSTYSKRMPNAPYYAIYNVGDYTFAPWKVIWAEQKGFCAAVAGQEEIPFVGLRPYVPDHKLFFVEFSSPEPAYYLCGLLNTPSVIEYIESHNISIQIGDVFKHLSLPPFDLENTEHVEFSKLVKETHSAKDEDYKDLLASVKLNGEEILKKYTGKSLKDFKAKKKSEKEKSE